MAARCAGCTGLSPQWTMAAKPGTCANPGISIMSLPFLNRSTQISKWRDQLRQRFSPSRYLRRSDGLRLLAAGGAGSDWVIARGRCAYTVLDGGAVPAARRRDRKSGGEGESVSVRVELG